MLISTFFADCPRDSEQGSILGLFHAILLDREARHEIREAPRRGPRNQPEAREGQAGRPGVAERFVVSAGQRMNRRVKVPSALG
jgi:hypothetical protein